MNTMIALLRAVNVGGTGKIKMSDLKSLCETLGLLNVQTYIASGNVILQSKLKPDSVNRKIEQGLKDRFSLDTTVFVRTLEEISRVNQTMPFAGAAPNQVLVTFLDKKPAKNIEETAKNLDGEEIFCGAREVYVHYPDGISASTLKIPSIESGTARNMNTVRKLEKLAVQAGKH